MSTDENLPVVIESGFSADGATEESESLAVGQWYQYKSKDYEGLVCLTHVGSNYAELAFASSGGRIREHFDTFDQNCTPEPNYQRIIDQEISSRQLEVKGLMMKVRDVTARLAITPNPALHSEVGSHALALRGNDQAPKEYKAALTKAKEKELPDLFEEIESKNKELSRWMKSALIPLQAQVELMKPVISSIEDRIFSVELYAGLTEEVVKVRDGDPAELQEKIHLFQRRHYMDEECLARYEKGGMDFKDIHAFDEWIARDGNFSRILPFSRSVVAFQIRRNRKDHGPVRSFSQYIQFQNEHQYNKQTYLYIRNGSQLFRLSTEINFGESLFPEMSDKTSGQKMYAERDGRYKIITEAEYLGMVESEDAEEREQKRKYDAAPEKEKFLHRSSVWRRSKDYDVFDSSNVLYDDILKNVQKKMNEHNRLVLVLQGLLDRSPVLHPHPPWSLWDPNGFTAALELIYDSSRVLTSGDAPDFEAYRKKCNETLAVGSVTIGQRRQWGAIEAKREMERRANDHRIRNDYHEIEEYYPYGNPGPGMFARVEKLTKSRKATFTWDRERTRDNWNDEDKLIRCSFVADADRLFNVDAYKPGDFKIFFEDPRTREDYLRWAPLLLEAEEYHAGNRKVGKPAESSGPRPPSYSGKKKYATKKRLKELDGKKVELVRDVEMRDKTVHKAGSKWMVTGVELSKLILYKLDENGNTTKTQIYGLDPYSVELALSALYSEVFV